MTSHNYDVAIVGGGAAGLSAALVLARSRRRVVIVDAGKPRNAPAEHMHNFLSRDGMPPSELLAVGRAEVLGYGAEILSATVVRVETTCSACGRTHSSAGDPGAQSAWPKAGCGASAWTRCRATTSRNRRTAIGS